MIERTLKLYTKKEALERIKNKYKECLVEKAHTIPFTNNINIENIEEYWHKENTNDFSQLEKDLEILKIIKNHISVDKEEDEFPDFSIMFFENEKTDCDKLKEWLKDDK